MWHFVMKITTHLFIFVLSAVDNHSHLSVLQNLATVLGDNQTVQQLLTATNAQDIKNIFNDMINMKILVCGHGLGSSFMVE